MIKHLLEPFFKLLPDKLKRAYYKRAHQEALVAWELAGKPLPPPHIVKQQVIVSYQKQYGCDTLVETGTYRGDMVYALLKSFKKIYSIELSEELYSKAANRFKDEQHIEILQGDSSERLKDLLPALQKPAIFWLDAHYSGGVTAKGKKECPIYEELDAIFSSTINHILLIDDARSFDGTDDYPTISKLTAFILSHRPDALIQVKDDIIRVEPK